MSIRLKFVLLYVTVVCAFCACKKNDMEEKLLEEEKILAEYITDTFGDEAIFLGGGAYLVKTRKNEDGTTVEAGNYILWNSKVTNQITGELEYTSDKSSVKYPDSYVDGGPEITQVLSYKIDDGLVKMNKGEKGDIFVPSRWLYFDFQPRIFSVEIVDVLKDLSLYQEDLMNKYIRRTYERSKVDTIKNVLSTSDKSEYNVMYYIINHGEGDEITKGMNVETKTSTSYMIRERDVHSYMVDEDIKWSTNTGEKINTLTKTNCVGEILEKMNKGGKVVVTMSSKLYWEDDKLPKDKQTHQYFIPKWSVVIFTININK